MYTSTCKEEARRKGETMKKQHLTDGERRALDIILGTCDEVGNDYYTRLPDMVLALVEKLGNAQAAGGYITALSEKGILDFEDDYDGYGRGVWVNV